MSVEVTVPTLGESVSEATVAKWRKSAGDAVVADEAIVELETDKVTLEVGAPVSGTLAEIVAVEGSTVLVGALLGVIARGAGASSAPPVLKRDPGPAARRALAESGVDPALVTGTGKDGRITKADVAYAVERPVAGPEPIAPRPVPASTPVPAPTEPSAPPRSIWNAPSTDRPRADREERVKLTRLRQRIAERLKDAQNTAAILSTFNEVDMSAVRTLRDEYKESFERKHGVKLGFMSFFARAAVKALAEFPAVNAEIDGTDIVYKNYYDLGVAVGAPKGLVVPVLRDADRMTFAEIEKGVAALGRKAREGTLSIEELSGGTFTISNGGVYGSLLSTPIINPPQSGILGMHKIQDRPVAVDGQVVIRPMMYLALSYDHRVIDGREAVGFLARIKELVEDPRRLLLDV